MGYNNKLIADAAGLVLKLSHHCIYSMKINKFKLDDYININTLT